MPNALVAEHTLQVGIPIVVDGPSPSTAFMTVFEDDGNTGYFYGLDSRNPENPILDAMHVYNVENVTDKDQPSRLQIVWSNDGMKAALLINGYTHAVFDFQAQRGYCRTVFPPPDARWAQGSHDWDDAAIDLFRG